MVRRAFLCGVFDIKPQSPIELSLRCSMHVGHQSQHHIEPLGPLRYERSDVEEHFQTPYIYEMHSTLGRHSELR